MSDLICGTTGSGKSTAVLALTEGVQTVILDHQTESTAWNAWKRSLQQNQKAVLMDLDDLQMGMPINCSFKSTRDREALTEALIRRRGAMNLDASPIIETGLEMWCRLVPQEWSIKKQLRVFRSTAVFKQAIASCTDIEVIDWWEQLPHHQRERLIGPAERILSILGREHTAPRMQNDNRFIDLLEQGYSIFVQGGKLISEAEQRFILSFLLKKIIRWKQEVDSPELHVVIEESEAGDMLGMQETKAFQTLRKRKLVLHVVCQEPYWRDQQITNVVIQNTDHLWMRPNSEAVAEMAAKDLVPLFDGRAIKEIQERFVMLGDQEFLETRRVYWTPQEQQMLIKKWLMSLEIGQGFSRVGKDVRFIQVPRFESSITDAFAEQQRKQQPWLIPLKSDESESGSSANSSTSTRSPSNKPIDSDTSHRTTPPLDGLFDN